MSISSLVVHVRPYRARAVRDRLADLDGVEIHAATADGRLIVTVDQPDEPTATETLTAIDHMDGVLSAALVYSYFEDDSLARGEGR